MPKRKKIGDLIYPIRVVGYIMLGITVYIHAVSIDGELIAAQWLTIVICLLYPHLSYLIYQYTNKKRQTEFWNLTIDMFLIGWSFGALHYSWIYLWPFFLNNSATQVAIAGLKHATKGIISCVLGGFLGVWVFEHHYFPDLELLTGFWGVLYLFFSYHLLGFISFNNGNRLRKVLGKLNTQHQELMDQKAVVDQKAKALERLSNESERKHRDIQASISYAHRIQKSMLPVPDEMLKVFPLHFILYRPRDIVSGDFYWVSQNHDYDFVAVGDCTGHGIPGAFMSLIGINTLSEIVNMEKIQDPGQVLEKLRAHIQKSLHQRSSGNQDGMDIVFCALERNVRQGKRRILYSGAGNGLLVANNGEIERHKGDSLIIGGYFKKQAQERFETHVIELASASNQMLYLTTDGFQDQFGGPDNRKMTAKRFREILKDIHALPMGQQLERLDAALEEWKSSGKVRQVDDVTVIGIRLT